MKSVISSRYDRVFFTRLAFVLLALLALAVLFAPGSASAAASVNIGSATLNSSNPYYHNGDVGAQGVANSTEAGANAVFDSTTGTLTLKGLDISIDRYPGISASGDLTIVLADGTTNTVKGNYDGGILISGDNTILTIQGSGTLTATGGDNSANNSSYGIRNDAKNSGSKILISGSAKVFATGGESTSSNSYGIRVDEGYLEVSGNAGVTATGGTAPSGFSYGIDVNLCSIEISGNATVNATGGRAGSSSYGIRAPNGEIKIFGKANVTAKGGTGANSYGIGAYAKNVIISEEATVTATGSAGISEINSYGVYVDNVGNVIVKDSGKLYATGGKAFQSYGIYAYTGDVIISDTATVKAKGGEAKWSDGIRVREGKVEIASNTTVTAEGGSPTGGGRSCGVCAFYDNATLSIASGTFEGADYGLYCDKASTVTITGGMFIGTGTNAHAIHTEGTLNIQGNPTLTSTGSNIHLASGEKITITGKLTSTSTSPYTVSTGSWITEDLLIATATTPAHADASKFTLSGIQSGYELYGDVDDTGDIRVKKVYSVAFNSNGGAGTMSNQKFFVGITQALSANAFTRDNYTFAGWAKSADGDVEYVDEADVTNLTDVAGGTVTLYAKWTANEYKVHFDKNGADGTQTMSDQTFIYDVEQSLTANAFTKTGYTFAGWAESATSAVKYADKQKVQNLATGGTVTLFAKWTANPYSVAFDANGGAGTMAPQPFTYDQALTPLTANAFDRTGYTFEGWATSDTGDVAYTDGQSVENLATGGTFNLYAVWTANTYAVGLSAPDATNTYTTFVTATYDASMPPITVLPIRDGYTFEGYFDATPGGNKYYNADGTSARNWDKDDDTPTLHAQWTANEYTVEFDKNATDATGAMENQRFTYDEAQNLTVNDFKRAGYNFAGWAEIPDGPVDYTDGESVQNLTDADGATVTLYAQWNYIPPSSADPVVIITEDGKTIPCKDLQEALDMIAEGLKVREIVLNSDQTIEGELTIPEGLALNLNGYNLTCGKLIIEKGATVIISEGRQLTIGGSGGIGALVINGTLIVNGDLVLDGVAMTGDGYILVQSGSITLKGTCSGVNIRLAELQSQPAGAKSVSIPKVIIHTSFRVSGVTGKLLLPDECYEDGFKVLHIEQGADKPNFKLANAPDKTWRIDSDGCLSSDAVSVDLIPAYLTVGKNTKTNAAFLLPWKYEGAVTWSSADEKVLKVVKNGKKQLFKGVETGVSALTASFADGETRTVPVMVVLKKQAVSSVGGPNAIKLKRGETRQLTPKVKPAGALDKTLFWHSSDEKIATVENGLITGLSTGTCRVVSVATSGKRKVIKVTVTKKAAATSKKSIIDEVVIR